MIVPAKRSAAAAFAVAAASSTGAWPFLDVIPDSACSDPACAAIGRLNDLHADQTSYGHVLQQESATVRVIVRAADAVGFLAQRACW
jgi:hypothetical protein